MNMQQKKSEKQLANEKSDRIMQGVAYWQQIFGQVITGVIHKNL